MVYHNWIPCKNKPSFKKLLLSFQRRLLKNGTTTACYFGSIHLEGTLELVNSVINHNQRALVGKVSMNIKNDAGYFNETKKELEEVETFVKQVYAFKV